MPDWGAITAEAVSPLVPQSIGSLDPLAGDCGIYLFRTGNATNASPLTANLAYLIPFCINRAATCYKIGLANGTAVAGNIDVGIYNESFARVVSMGATAAAVANALQEFNIADTLLAAGVYYMAVSANTGAGMNVGQIPIGSNMTKMTGCVQMAAAHPLPATVTPAAPTSHIMPIMELFFRASP